MPAKIRIIINVICIVLACDLHSMSFSWSTKRKWESLNYHILIGIIRHLVKPTTISTCVCLFVLWSVGIPVSKAISNNFNGFDLVHDLAILGLSTFPFQCNRADSWSINMLSHCGAMRCARAHGHNLHTLNTAEVWRTDTRKTTIACRQQWMGNFTQYMETGVVLLRLLLLRA